MKHDDGEPFEPVTASWDSGSSACKVNVEIAGNDQANSRHGLVYQAGWKIGAVITLPVSKCYNNVLMERNR